MYTCVCVISTRYAHVYDPHEVCICMHIISVCVISTRYVYALVCNPHKGMYICTYVCDSHEVRMSV